MYCKSVMLLGLVVPSKGILALFLFPQYLEHGAVVHDVKSFIDSLDRDTLSIDCHLVHERI